MALPSAAARPRMNFASRASAFVLAWGWIENHLWLALPLLALPAWWPFLSIGLPKGSDTLMHLMRLGALDYQLQQGTLYPRWVPQLMLGHGYPVFNFYGPLTYYLAEGLHLAGLSYYYAFMALCALLVLGAGFGMYLLARDTFGADRPWPALLAATAYMYAPYLLTNVMVRGAIAEAGAQALLPVIFWSTRRLLTSREPGRYVLAVALSLGALAVCHNITLMFAPPVLLAYSAAIWWQTGRGLPRLGWLALGLAAAVGASAFFVLPLAVERRFLIESPYEISRGTLPENAWHGLNFLNQHLIYFYSFAVPFQIGLVQLILAVGGAIAARRRDAEWLFWIVTAAAAALGVTAWSLPIWLNSPILLIAQFPWRLLSIASVPLALLAGGCVSGLGRRRGRAILTLPLLVIIAFTQAPRLDNWLFFSAANTRIAPPVSAHLELDTRAMGASGIQEFRPRWAQGDSRLDQRSAAGGAAPAEIALQGGNAYDLTASVSSPGGGPLRFESYYYPGWRAILDEDTVLPVYPSTNLGLVTVDVPPGRHRVRLSWSGTPAEHLAGLLTLLTLAGLAWLAWRQPDRRSWALLPLVLLLLGIGATAWPRPVMEIQPPTEPALADGTQLLGYRLEQDRPTPGEAYVYLYPYWFVSAALPEDWQIRWRLQGADGRTVSETVSRPYFNTSRASDWAVSSLVDDAYQLRLPAGLPAGTYGISGQVLHGDTPAGKVFRVGTVAVPSATPVQVAPEQRLDIRMGDRIRLEGFNLRAKALAPGATGARPTIVHAGQQLVYTLYWRATGPVPKDYHAFVHLVDNAGETIASADQLPGPSFRPPMLWDGNNLQSDDYLLWIPDDAPSGLYWPTAGLYEYVRGTKTPEQLAAYDATGQELTRGARLPPVKIVGPDGPAPQQPLDAKYPGLATLTGYDLASPGSGIRAGSALTLTLHYRVIGTTDRDYTRFVHLYGPGGQVTGSDSPPADGANPTWAWTPGETIRDRVQLKLEQGLPAGRYTLSTGLYDRDNGDARVPVTDGQGHGLANAEVIIGQVEVLP